MSTFSNTSPFLFFMGFRINYGGSPIGSVGALAATLGYDAASLARLVKTVGDHYIKFELPKKSGGVRQICSPKPELKAIQQRINTRIFGNCKFPWYLQGSIKDPDRPRDFVSNAREHAKGKHFILSDIESFFPSMRPGNVKKVFKYLFRFPDDVSDVLVALTTLDNQVPQGAPTSSYLANLIFYDVEHTLVSDLQKVGCRYTRLIDDISVSSEKLLTTARQRWVIAKIRALAFSKQLRLHPDKTKVIVAKSAGSSVYVTGLWIDKGHPRMAPDTRHVIRSQVNLCKELHAAGHHSTSDYHVLHNKTSGRVALMSRLGHPQGNVYREILRPRCPVYSKKAQKKLIVVCEMFFSRKGTGSEELSYARKFYWLMYRLGILGRSQQAIAQTLRSKLKKYPPVQKLREGQDD